MQGTTGRILRSQDVKLEGQLKLELNHRKTAANNNHNPPRNGNTTAVPPEVTIVENNPDFTVLRINCACGQQAHIRCEHKTMAKPAEQGTQEAVVIQPENPVLKK
jgi:hypothetical protein